MSLAQERDILSSFNNDGYYVIKNVFSEIQVNFLREFMFSEFEKRRKQGVQIQAVKKYPFQDIIPNVYGVYPEITDTLCNDKVVSVLKIILGDKFVLTPETSAMRDVYSTLHTDTTTCEMQGFSFHQKPHFKLVTLAIYLQENHPIHGGGLFIVPGSQNEPDYCVKLRKRRFEKSFTRKIEKWIYKFSNRRYFNYDNLLQNDPRGIDIFHSLGDVIIFNSKIIHRASIPKEDYQTDVNSIDKSKFAIYANLMTDNELTIDQVNFLRSRTDTPVYNYLREFRDIQFLQNKCQELGFRAL